MIMRVSSDENVSLWISIMCQEESKVKVNRDCVLEFASKWTEAEKWCLWSECSSAKFKWISLQCPHRQRSYSILSLLSMADSYPCCWQSPSDVVAETMASLVWAALQKCTLDIAVVHDTLGSPFSQGQQQFLCGSRRPHQRTGPPRWVSSSTPLPSSLLR